MGISEYTDSGFILSFHYFMGNIFGGNMKDWKESKARILALPLEERRKLYTCGDQFVPLDQISTWSEQQAAESNENKPADHDDGNDDVKPKVTIKEEDKTTEDQTDNDANSGQDTVESDPDWINQLKDDLTKDVEDKKINLNLDLSTKVSVFVGDITKLELDAIVNAANNSLLGGGGVDGAIHKAAGELLIEENKTHGGCKNGEAKLSCGYRLPAKYIMSVVGPRGEKPDLLSLSYTNCLNLLVSAGLRTIVSTLVQHSVFFILCP